MITFKARPRCAECGATGERRRFSIYRFPMVAAKPGTGVMVYRAGQEPFAGGGEFIGEATLVRQLCGQCKPRRAQDSARKES